MKESLIIFVFVYLAFLVSVAPPAPCDDHDMMHQLEKNGVYACSFTEVVALNTKK